MDIQKFKLISNNICYGPEPSPNDEVEQHLTISATGDVWFIGYNYGRAMEIPENKDWHFKFPQLYKHYMMTIYNQYKCLPTNYEERFSYIKGELFNAIELNNKISDFGILFNSDNDGSHLECWVTAINQFDRYLKES